MNCPDDLFSLSEAERNAHVASCVFCALEMSAQGAQQPVPVRAGLVDRVLDEHRRAEGMNGPKRRRLRGILLMAAGLAFIVGVAAASTRSFWTAPSPQHAQPVAPQPLLSALSGALEPRENATAPLDIAKSEPTFNVADLPVTKETTHEDAPTLFAKANAARRSGDVAAAEAGYRALIAEYPASNEAQTSHVSLGLLLLDRKNDAQGARAELDAYLRNPANTSLREQSLVGKARALGKLGDRDGERATWRQLLREYPESIDSPTAHDRLGD